MQKYIFFPNQQNFFCSGDNVKSALVDNKWDMDTLYMEINKATHGAKGSPLSQGLK